MINNNTNKYTSIEKINRGARPLDTLDEDGDDVCVCVLFCAPPRFTSILRGTILLVIPTSAFIP